MKTLSALVVVYALASVGSCFTNHDAPTVYVKDSDVMLTPRIQADAFSAIAEAVDRATRPGRHMGDVETKDFRVIAWTHEEYPQTLKEYCFSLVEGAFYEKCWLERKERLGNCKIYIHKEKNSVPLGCKLMISSKKQEILDKMFTMRDEGL